MSDVFAAVRVQRINNLAQLGHASAHGKRIDAASQKRVDPARTVRNLVVSDYVDDALDLVGAFKAFKSKTGAVEGKGKAAIALHVIAVISPELIRDAGDPHDPRNPVNQRIFAEAQNWARKTFGEGSVLQARMDMDEEGAGVVDLFVCPTAMMMGGRRQQEKLTISVNSALSASQKATGERNGFSALQTSWANHARSTVDYRLLRGRPKSETMRQHVHADLFRERAQQIEAALKSAQEVRRKADEAVKEVHSDRRLITREVTENRLLALDPVARKLTFAPGLQQIETQPVRDALNRQGGWLVNFATVMLKAWRAVKDTILQLESSVRDAAEDVARRQFQDEDDEDDDYSDDFSPR